RARPGRGRPGGGGLCAPPPPLPEGRVAAARRYWQHYMLLWQARRSIADGWANVNSTATAPSWYCLDAAKQSIDTARELARGPDPNLAPSEIERRLADVMAEEVRRPVVLALRGTPLKIIGDEPVWNSEFTLTRGPGDRVGFPVYWIEPPGPPYAKPNPNLSGRRLESRLVQEQSVKHQVRFDSLPKPADAAKPGELRMTVLYRGQRYVAKTELRLAGPPPLTAASVPAPPGPGRRSGSPGPHEAHQLWCDILLGVVGDHQPLDVVRRVGEGGQVYLRLLARRRRKIEPSDVVQETLFRAHEQRYVPWVGRLRTGRSAPLSPGGPARRLAPAARGSRSAFAVFLVTPTARWREEEYGPAPCSGPP